MGACMLQSIHSNPCLRLRFAACMLESIRRLLTAYEPAAIEIGVKPRPAPWSGEHRSNAVVALAELATDCT